MGVYMSMACEWVGSGCTRGGRGAKVERVRAIKKMKGGVGVWRAVA